MARLLTYGVAVTATVVFACSSAQHRQSSLADAASSSAVSPAAASASVGAGAIWQQQGDTYTLIVAEGTSSSLQLVVDAGHGGRIASLTFGGQQVLSPGTGQLQGSTFWSSPQAAWNWPPAPEIDSASYNANLSQIHQRPTLILKSQNPEPKTGLFFGKTISYDALRQAIQIDYSYDNQSGNPRWVSPWEITRVPLGGLVFFPKESDYKGSSVMQLTQEDNSLGWLKSGPSTHDKLFRDGAEAWIAHAYQGVLLVKKYQENMTTADFALIGQVGAEAEIELYGNPQVGYVEVEDQGPYRQLASGHQRVWTVMWYVRPMPVGTSDQDVGSSNLVAFARHLISL